MIWFRESFRNFPRTSCAIISQLVDHFGVPHVMAQVIQNVKLNGKDLRWVSLGVLRMINKLSFKVEVSKQWTFITSPQWSEWTTQLIYAFFPQVNPQRAQNYTDHLKATEERLPWKLDGSHENLEQDESELKRVTYLAIESIVNIR